LYRVKFLIHTGADVDRKDCGCYDQNLRCILLALNILLNLHGFSHLFPGLMFPKPLRCLAF